jgi:uncharacterized protein
MNRHSLFSRHCNSQIPRRNAAALMTLLLSAGLACSIFSGPYRTEIRRIHSGMSLDEVRGALGEPYGYGSPDELFYYKTGMDTLLAVLVKGSELCPPHGDGVCGWMLLELPPTGIPRAGTFAYYKVKERGGAATGPYAIGTTIIPPIWDAAYFDELQRVKSLLKDNPDLVFLRYNGGETPLFTAVSSRDEEMTEFMLANKADVNAKDDRGWTPLHLAYDNKRMAALLLAHGAEVNAMDKDGETPLGRAEHYSYKDVAELLRQHGGHE